MRLYFSDLLLCLQPSEWSDALRRPLLKGLPLSLFGQVPNGMLVYGSYEVYKREIHERFPGMNPNQVAPSMSPSPHLSFSGNPFPLSLCFLCPPHCVPSIFQRILVVCCSFA